MLGQRSPAFTAAGGGTPEGCAVAGAVTPSFARPMPTLADFVVQPKAKPKAAPNGPPGEMQDTVAPTAARGWAVPENTDEQPPSITEIFVEEQERKAKPQRRGRAGGRRGNDDETRNSWGREAMPETQPAPKSLLELQAEEKERERLATEERELLEIEAMFEALRVAEEADLAEQAGPRNIPPPGEGRTSAPRGRGRGERERGSRGRGGGGKGRHKGSWAADAWWRTGGWADSGWWAAGEPWLGRHQDEAATGGDGIDAGVRWKPRQGEDAADGSHDT